MIGRTTDSYVQLIYTARMPGYRRGRMCLVGDAGAVAQPFTGSGVFKGHANVAALLGALGQSLDIGTIVAFGVCLGIAVDDTVHFLSHYDEYRKQGHDPMQATALIFDRTMPALVTTTVTLVVAFGVFAFSSFAPNRMFGLLVAFILDAALITDAFLLPALLMRRDASA